MSNEGTIKEKLEIAKKVWVRTSDIQKFVGCSYPKANSIKTDVVKKYYKDEEGPTMRGAILCKYFLDSIGVKLEDLQERAAL